MFYGNGGYFRFIAFQPMCHSWLNHEKLYRVITARLKISEFKLLKYKTCNGDDNTL